MHFPRDDRTKRRAVTDDNAIANMGLRLCLVVL